MSRAFVLTPSASRDVDGILEYVLEHSGPNRALHVHYKLYEGFSKVGAQPNFLGHKRDDLADESLRVFGVFSYLLTFRPETKPVQIIRVIHGARELRAIFAEENPGAVRPTPNDAELEKQLDATDQVNEDVRDSLENLGE